MNVVGAVKLARRLLDTKMKKGEKTGKTGTEKGTGTGVVNVVTVICDGGDRYQSKLWDRAWLEEKLLVPRASAPPLAGDGVWFVE
jgi:hypothetical protein